MLQLQEPINDWFDVHAIQAEVNDDVVNGSVGWQLGPRGCGIGRHFDEKHQDPLHGW